MASADLSHPQDVSTQMPVHDVSHSQGSSESSSDRAGTCFFLLLSLSSQLLQGDTKKKGQKRRRDGVYSPSLIYSLLLLPLPCLADSSLEEEKDGAKKVPDPVKDQKKGKLHWF